MYALKKHIQSTVIVGSRCSSMANVVNGHRTATTRRSMQIGDLVRYRQGSLDKMGIVTGREAHLGDYWVQFADGSAAPCRWRCLEVLSASR